MDWAAIPTTTPAMPAEASSPAPSARTWGKVKSIAPSATTMITAEATRRTRVIWVRIRRARRLPSPSTATSRASTTSVTAKAAWITSQATAPIMARLSSRWISGLIEASAMLGS